MFVTQEGYRKVVALAVLQNTGAKIYPFFVIAPLSAKFPGRTRLTRRVKNETTARAFLFINMGGGTTHARTDRAQERTTLPQVSR